MKKILFLVAISICFNSIVFSQVSKNGLLASYKFNNDYTDSSGNKRHALYANTKFVDDRDNNANSAVEFNGEHGFVTSYIGSHANLTVAFWFKPETQVDAYPHMWDYGSYSYRGMIMAGSIYGTSDRHKVYSGTNYPNEVFTKSTSTVTYDQWQHIAFVFDNTNKKIQIYTDGVFSSETAITSTLSPQDSTIMFGRVKTSVLSQIITSNFKGAIDDIYIYNRPLTATEVKDLKDENFSTLGIPKTPKGNTPEDIIIFPNPTKNLFNIQINNDEVKATSVKIFDVTGKLVILSYDINQINVSTLSTGTYIVQVINKDNIVLKSEKIIKE